MRRLILVFPFIFLFVLRSKSQLTCNNWLSTPSYQSYVSVGDLDIPGNQITVEAVFNRTAPYTGGEIWAGDLVSKHVNPTDANYLLRPNTAEITTSNGYFRTPDICEIELNKTYHAALVYDGVTLKFYRNGFLMSSVPATGNLYQNDYETRIGLYDALLYNTNLIGYINEVRIWNVARTQAQIRSYMNTSLPNPTTQVGLQAYYTFDNLLNKQGNAAWNGTLGGSASINASNPTCASFVADSCAVPVSQEYTINNYTEALNLDPCKNILNVKDASAFNVGDTVLLIQMKGAIIDSSNSATFGNITNYRNAGNYEFNIISGKTGNSLSLLNVITRQYDFLDGKVQLIRVPYFDSYIVPANYTLTCLPWNGSIGGILALNVKNDLVLNGNIDASGKGFRGGASPNTGNQTFRCFYNNYIYPSGELGAAAKGESISLIGDDKSWGKGAPSNGGGGGLGHNSGGGGGANGGAGGFGGYQLLPCGNAPFDNRGIGGYDLSYSNLQNKIFLGGGGGSGHVDNAGGSNMEGGNGGGIIIIQSGSINANGFTISSNGNNATQCDNATFSNCHDGSGGGGGGGTVLINTNNYLTNALVNTKGGKGGDLIIYNPAASADKIGPGGGGGGGVIWINSAAAPAGLTGNLSLGQNGVIIPNNNDPWGATAGKNGIQLFSLKIPVDNILFKQNIDSVRIKATQTSCSSFSFEGLGYTNSSPVTDWQWHFGDGDTAKTQVTSHKYQVSGGFDVNLIITDTNDCRDSIATHVITSALDGDFNYKIDACNPLMVRFTGAGTAPTNIKWNMGDGSPVITGSWDFTHTYATEGDYTIGLIVSNGTCNDTIYKTIPIRILKGDIILTPDTTICAGTSKQLKSVPSLSFCWTPATYLDNPNSQNPVTSTPQNITYYLTAEVQGSNLITNGDFSGGNASFTSEYNYAANNTTEGQYTVGTNPSTWNASLSSCKDHTSGNGKMMLVNGAPVAGVNVWKQTVTVTPNTNYAFSTWIDALYTPNPAQLQFSINGNTIGNLITASLPTCTWTQFYTTWNSGSNTTAIISIVNKNTQIQGNDFALDDISFAPVLIKRDSVIISVETPSVIARADTLICDGAQVSLSASGSQGYSWTPGSVLNNSNIANPVAKPSSNTQFIVTGTSARGCKAKDTVNVLVNPKPVIVKSANALICKNGSAQLSASGGNIYSWAPAQGLSNPNIPNPVATPGANTTYTVNVTDANNCSNIDSIKVSIRPDPVFTISPDASICENKTTQLVASGGDQYQWQPAESLSNAAISNPIASPTANTTYSVLITDTVCGNSTTLTTAVSISPAPKIVASKSNDIDCSRGTSQLSATGGVQYQWTPTETLDNPNIYNPVASPRTTTKYTVKGTNSLGCSNYDSVLIDFKGINEGLYLMPSAFTPNNDGLNDCYRVKYWGFIYELDFSVFNRWGERVFHTKNPSDCWDGTYKGVPQKSDVYVYIIKAKTLCNESVFKKGTFALIR
ncbi:MAG: PKD domain-containing protein [Chitinophagaceae bacterium]